MKGTKVGKKGTCSDSEKYRCCGPLDRCQIEGSHVNWKGRLDVNVL